MIVKLMQPRRIALLRWCLDELERGPTLSPGKRHKVQGARAILAAMDSFHAHALRRAKGGAK